MWLLVGYLCQWSAQYASPALTQSLLQHVVAAAGHLLSRKSPGQLTQPPAGLHQPQPRLLERATHHHAGAFACASWFCTFSYILRRKWSCMLPQTCGMLQCIRACMRTHARPVLKSTVHTCQGYSGGGQATTVQSMRACLSATSILLR